MAQYNIWHRTAVMKVREKVCSNLWPQETQLGPDGFPHHFSARVSLAVNNVDSIIKLNEKNKLHFYETTCYFYVVSMLADCKVLYNCNGSKSVKIFSFR